MITIRKGLQNSLIVLEHLRKKKYLQKLDITIGTFTNCRECGLTFLVSDYSKKENQTFTFCIYEHRNSDTIIINGKAGHITMNGDLPYKTDNKNEYIAEFSCEQYYQCAKKLADLIKEFYNKKG